MDRFDRTAGGDIPGKGSATLVPLRDWDAVILCGGLGSHLRPAMEERPRCLSPVAGRPFLEYVLLQLRSFGLRNVTVCVNYLNHRVPEYFETGDRWDMTLTYLTARQALGTAGALKRAQGVICSSSFLVLNGDSLFDIDLKRLLEFHQVRGAQATVALATVRSPEGHAEVHTDEAGNVTGFLERRGTGHAAAAARERCARVNGGVYVLNREILDEIPAAPPPVSLESDVLPRLIGRRLCGLPAEGRFIDIRVPQDYSQAQRELPGRFVSR